MRAFLALDIPEEVKGRLTEWIARLRPLTRGVKWVSPQAMHLTLHFFDDLPEEELAAVSGSLAGTTGRAKPFTFALRGLGCFGQAGKIRVVWCGVEEPSGALAELHRSVESSLAAIGFPGESRPFHPHLTLGRLRVPSFEPRLSEELKRSAGSAAGEVAVRDATLYQSTLTPAGPVYRALGHFPLGGTP